MHFYQHFLVYRINTVLTKLLDMKTFTIAFMLILGCFACNQSSNQENTPVENETAPEEYLLYISSRGNGFDIYRNNLKGDSEQILTGDPGWEWQPQPIPGLNQVVFNSQDTSGQFAMKAMDFNGQKLDYQYLDLPDLTYSPNGRWLSFIRREGDQSRILICPSTNLSDSLVITSEGPYNGRVKWANQGNQLIYISDRTGSNEIYRYDLSSQQTSRITNNDLREKYCSWSPDDQQIATTMQTDSTENDIFIINLADLATKQLTNSSINESEIAWSPLGSYIAYHAQVDEKDDIYIVDINSKNSSQITKGEGYHGEPAWILINQ